MTKIYIDDDVSEIVEIAWVDEDGCDESIRITGNALEINNSSADITRIFKGDIPKLIKALNKAKELGWWKDE
jgi:hypothetical protein